MTASTHNLRARQSVFDRAARSLGIALLAWSRKRTMRARVTRDESARRFIQDRALETREHANSLRAIRLP